MRRAVLLALGFWLLGRAWRWRRRRQASLPEGTFATTQDGCTKLEKKTPAELGEDLDFQVLSKKGLTAYQQICDFVNVVGHDATSWVATAFCDEGGYTYPDLFSIKQKDETRSTSRRITDLTEQSSDDSSIGLQRLRTRRRSAESRRGKAERARRGKSAPAGRAGRQRILQHLRQVPDRQAIKRMADPTELSIAEARDALPAKSCPPTELTARPSRRDRGAPTRR